MIRKIAATVGLAVALASCGGGDAPGEQAQTPGSAAQSSDASATAAGEYSRESFVLCPAFEPYREELASIVGFEQDPERDLSVLSGECIVHGADAGFARVTLAPAVMPSVSMYVEGFDAPVGPAPELGPEARFVDAPLQPHVVFTMGRLILDVDAENIETPSRDTMIELATRVREILVQANR